MGDLRHPPVPAALILASAYPLSQGPSDTSSLTRRTLSRRRRLSGLPATPPKCDEKSWGPPPELAKTSRPLLHRTFGGGPSSLKAQQEPKRASRPRQTPSPHPAMVNNNAPLMGRVCPRSTLTKVMARCPPSGRQCLIDNTSVTEALQGKHSPLTWSSFLE